MLHINGHALRGLNDRRILGLLLMIDRLNRTGLHHHAILADYLYIILSIKIKRLVEIGMRLALQRHIILIPLVSRELISAVVFGAQEREHIIPFLLYDRAPIAYIESAGTGISTAAELIETHGSRIMAWQSIVTLSN